MAASSEPIGKIVGTDEAGEPWEATLTAEGRWETADPEVALYLSLTHDPVLNGEVGDGIFPFGRAALARAATDLKAEAAYTRPLPPLPEGAVS